MQYLATLDNDTKLYLRNRMVIATNDEIRAIRIGDFAPTTIYGATPMEALWRIYDRYGFSRVNNPFTDELDN
jgi:hypothetical protein